jgi:hypothetical protein
LTPEEVEGLALSSAVDVFRAALYLFFMATGEQLFGSTGQSEVRILEDIRAWHGTDPRLDGLGPLGDVLARCLHPEPSKRVSARDAVSALDPIALDEEQTKAELLELVRESNHPA